MERKYLLLCVGLIALAVAVLGFNSYLSPSGALVATGGAIGATGSLTVATVTLLIALTLFAKYFNLIK